MPTFNARVLFVTANGPKTIQQLIQENLAARTFADSVAVNSDGDPVRLAADREADEIGRWFSATPREGYLRPAGAIYLLDAYKGVDRQGQCNTNANKDKPGHDGVLLVAADFTDDPAATIWIEGQAKDLSGVYLGGQVVYAAADTYIDLDNLVVA